MPAAADPEGPWEELEPVWRAYWALAVRRHWTVVVLPDSVARVAEPLLFSEICAAADRFGFSGRDRFDHFLEMISAIDGAHLKILDKR